MRICRLASLGGVFGAACLAAALGAPLSSPAPAWAQEQRDLVVAEQDQADAANPAVEPAFDGGSAAQDEQVSPAEPSTGAQAADEGAGDSDGADEPAADDAGQTSGAADGAAADGSQTDAGDADEATGDAGSRGEATFDDVTDPDAPSQDGADVPADDADKDKVNPGDSTGAGDSKEPAASDDPADSDAADKTNDASDKADKTVGVLGLRYYVVTSEGKVAYASLSEALAAAGVTRSADGAALCVALDAAHDASHAGTSLGELGEADLTLAVAQQLSKQASADASLNIALVRAAAQALFDQADEASEFEARVAAAKQAGADVLIELHVNLSGTSDLTCALPAAADGMPIVAVELCVSADAAQLDYAWLADASQQMGQGLFDPEADSATDTSSDASVEPDASAQIQAEAYRQARLALADQLRGLAEDLSAFAQAAPVNPDADIDPQDSDSSAAAKFVDTPADAWYVTGGYLDYVVQAGLMTGYTDGKGKFGPEVSITREQVVTVLYRCSGASYSGDVSHFSDVATGKYYSAAVEWAYQNGVVTGYDGTGKFGVGDPIKREDFCTMLYRFAKRCGYSGSSSGISSFPDASSVDSWAKDGVAWCVTNKVITGDEAWTPAHINPQGYTLRCQAAKMFTVLARDVLKGATFDEVTWNFDGVSASTSYILSTGTVQIAPKLTGSTSGLSFEYGWASSNGNSWTSGAQSASSYTMYLGSTGTFTISVKVSDSTGVSHTGTCVVTVWDLNAQVSSDGGANWTATAGITGATDTSGFTYKYTWRRGEDEATSITLGSETGGASKKVTLPGQDYYIFYIKATDPEGHTTFSRKTFLYAPSGKLGWQNPSDMYQVSAYNVSPHNYNRGVLSYMSTSRISANATRSQVVEAFIARAYEYMGTSYVWNYACAPGVGVDCVGLVMQCMYAVGMNTLTTEGAYDCFCPICHWDSGSSGWHSHDANNLRQYGKIHHVSKTEMQRGDLIFWNGHVAIYLGDGQMIQALPGQVYTTSIYNSSSYNYDSIVDVGRLFA